MQTQLIVVPTDFSHHADHALDYAVEMATKLGARIVVLHAYSLPSSGISIPTTFVTDLMGQIAEAADDALKAIQERYKASGVRLDMVLRQGDPRQEIIGYAKENHAWLICMGTQGRRGLSRMLIGSVAEEVLREAPCPVLTVRSHKTAP